MDEMIFRVENVGPISSADMKLGKINIIKGANASGKTFLSKLLFCFLTAKSKQTDEILNETLKKHMRHIRNWFIHFNHDNKNFDPDLIHYIRKVSYIKDYGLDETLRLFDKLSCYADDFEGSGKKYFDTCEKFISSWDDKELLFKNIIEYLISSEFSNDSFEGKASTQGFFKGQNFDSSIDFKEGIVTGKRSRSFDNIFYLDEELIYSHLFNNSYYSNHLPFHYKIINNSLKPTQHSFDIFNNEIEEVEKELFNLNRGKFTIIKDELFFENLNGKMIKGADLSAATLSTCVLQLLLSNHQLSERSFLIIDGVDSRLDLQAKVQLAEILVFLTKKLNMHILITSYQEEFIEAITLCSRKYGLINDTKLFINEVNEDYSVNVVDKSNQVNEAIKVNTNPLEALRAEVALKEAEMKEDEAKDNGRILFTEDYLNGLFNEIMDKMDNLKHGKYAEFKEVRDLNKELISLKQELSDSKSPDVTNSLNSKLNKLKLQRFNLNNNLVSIKDAISHYNFYLSNIEYSLRFKNIIVFPDEYYNHNFYFRTYIPAGMVTFHAGEPFVILKELIPKDIRHTNWSIQFDGKKFPIKLGMTFKLIINHIDSNGHSKILEDIERRKLKSFKPELYNAELFVHENYDTKSHFLDESSINQLRKNLNTKFNETYFWDIVGRNLARGNKYSFENPSSFVPVLEEPVSFLEELFTYDCKVKYDNSEFSAILTPNFTIDLPKELKEYVGSIKRELSSSSEPYVEVILD